MTDYGNMIPFASEYKTCEKNVDVVDDDVDVVVDDDDDDDDITCEKRRIRSPTAKLSSRMPRKT